MEMTGKEKLYFLLDAIDDAKTIAPNSQPLIVDPANDLNRRIRDIELKQLFTKLQDDEKVLSVIQAPSSILSVAIIEDLDPYDHVDDGCWHVKLLPKFDSYYLKIQYEVEYQEFTGKKPPELLKKETEKQRSEQALRPTFLPKYYNDRVETKSAKEIVDEFSVKNRVYVASVLEEILSCSDFADDEIYYQTTTLGGQSLINERSLVKKLSSFGLYTYIGVEDVGDSIRLRDLNKKLTQEVVDLLRADNVSNPMVTNKFSSDHTAKWSDDFKWEGNKFVFGEYGSIAFTSLDRKHIFKSLVDKHGGWATLSEMKGTKSAEFVRSTIKQIEDRLPIKSRGHIKIVSTLENKSVDKPIEGAYKIEFTS